MIVSRTPGYCGNFACDPNASVQGYTLTNARVTFGDRRQELGDRARGHQPDRRAVLREQVPERVVRHRATGAAPGVCCDQCAASSDHVTQRTAGTQASHWPFRAGAQSYGERTALRAAIATANAWSPPSRRTSRRSRARDPSRAPFADTIRFTENSVEMPIGEGLWATVTSVNPADGMIAADTESGNTAWFGHAEENGKLVFLAIRIKVDGGRITEAETVIARRTGMPLIFGTGKQPHQPGLDPGAHAGATAPPAAPAGRGRTPISTTVEFNNGQVFAQFKPDCSRLENGISTTAATGNATSSASVAEGCEAQFKLGIYRINKQLRERRYPVIDVERGIVVGMNFFDHANTFDEYTAYRRPHDENAAQVAQLAQHHGRPSRSSMARS